MKYQTTTIDELEGRALEEILRSVLADQKILAVQLSDGAEVVIQPRPRLKPLPILEGYVPEGWKDDIYLETPWEWYGAFKNDPTWGELFDDIERRRSSDDKEMFACQ